MIKSAYTLHRSVRVKRVCLHVHLNKVVVVAPHHASLQFVDDFVHKNYAWICQKQKELSVRQLEWIMPEGILQDSLHACKNRAKKFILERLYVYAPACNNSFQQISVKSMTSRWGSCSKNGNMSFHYRLFFLPVELADYVIVHELCHLKYMNHSKRFWIAVSQIIPEYVVRRKLLERYSVL